MHYHNRLDVAEDIDTNKTSVPKSVLFAITSSFYSKGLGFNQLS